MSDYPAPSYAASIWTVGDTIHMTLPPVYGQEKGHSVVFPNSPAGWLAINSILRDRERQERRRAIGTRAAPVQYDIDKMVQAMGKPITQVPSARKVQAPPDLSLEDLGL